MHVKLYKPDSERRLYWQAWDCDGRVAFHTGEVGRRGTTEWVTPSANQTPEETIRARAEAAGREGFAPVGLEAMEQIILSCPTESDWTPDEILGVARYLEELCNECLGWTGLGHCDGRSYGPRSVGVCSLVVDQALGIQAIIAELQRHGCEGKDEELVLSVPEGAGFRVVYTTGPPSNG